MTLNNYSRTHTVNMVKGGVSKSLENEISLKLADTVTFPTNTSSMVKNLQMCILFASNWVKHCLLLVV